MILGVKSVFPTRCNVAKVGCNSFPQPGKPVSQSQLLHLTFLLFASSKAGTSVILLPPGGSMEDSGCFGGCWLLLGAASVRSGSPCSRFFWGPRSGLDLVLTWRYCWCNGEAVSRADCLIGAVNAWVSLLVSTKSTEMPQEEHLFLTGAWLGRHLTLIQGYWTARPFFQCSYQDYSW